MSQANPEDEWTGTAYKQWMSWQRRIYRKATNINPDNPSVRAAEDALIDEAYADALRTERALLKEARAVDLEAERALGSPYAAHLAGKLRTAMKDQALNGPAIADEVERLTGVRPSLMQVSRWLSGAKPLIRIAPELFVLAEIAGLDVTDLVFTAMRETEPAEPAA